MTNKEASTFTLSTSNADFQKRQKNLFDSLGSLEIKLTGNNPIENEEEPKTQFKSNQSSRKNRSSTKQFRGKESIFKKPQIPRGKHFMRTLPDFKKNPHKWTKYTLEDVKDDDISDGSNTKTALDFLKEIEERKLDSSPQKTERSIHEKLMDGSHKIVFQKGTSSQKQSEDSNIKPSFHASKLVLPEYVVGQQVKKKKTKRPQSKTNGIQLRLDHLIESDE